MCLLTFLPGSVMPDLAALRNGALLNTDGYGYAIVDDRQLIIGHGMDANETIDAFAQARHRHRSGPALFHSRLCTHGKPTLDNCHPLPIGGDERTVLAHNGVLPRAVHPAKGDPRSDTRIAAEEFIPTLGPLRMRANRRRLQRWMNVDNRMVLLTVDRRFRQRAYLLNEKTGIWHNGTWYSNDDFLPSRWPAADLTRRDRNPAVLPGWVTDPGEVCATHVDPRLAECPTCGWCALCGEPPETCSCPADPADTQPWWLAAHRCLTRPPH